MAAADGGCGFEHEEAGFWAVVKADDIRHVSLNNEVFKSGVSGTVDARPMPFPRSSLLISDPPEHGRLRKMLSAAFTPVAVRRLTEKMEERAGQIVDRVRGAGHIDFVSEVSSQLPMLTIADLFGIPEELIPEFTQAGTRMGNFADPDVRNGMGAAEFLTEQVQVMRRIGVEVVKLRRKHPADDLATVLGRPDAEGKFLSEEAIGQMPALLSGAGNDTTKHTTSWAVYQLWNDPQQKRWLADDYDARIAGAIEEFIRHASPVGLMAQTAVEDTEIRGRKISKYDKVVMYYCSGNRDEEVRELDECRRTGPSSSPECVVVSGRSSALDCPVLLERLVWTPDSVRWKP